MVKKDWQDLRVWFNQAAYVLTSLRLQLVRLRQACFHNLPCTRGGPSSEPLNGPRITAESPSAFSLGMLPFPVGKGVGRGSVALAQTRHPFFTILSCFDSVYGSSALHQWYLPLHVLNGVWRCFWEEGKERGKRFHKDISDSTAKMISLIKAAKMKGHDAFQSAQDPSQSTALLTRAD